jgi:uncharacterized protein (TIGR00661 family)
MKILYAIQGTGNGHLSRATEIIPHLQARAKVDLLVSGTESEITLPYPIRYYFKGVSLWYDKKGGISLKNTYSNNEFRTFWHDVKRLPVEEYDFIINDFEPISAWAAWKKKKTCIALSNQCAVLSEKAPQPRFKDPFGKFILRNYAPATAQYGIHFAKYDDNVFTPIIRKEVRVLNVSDKGHYTVYLPSYSNERIVANLGAFQGVKWEVFSKNCLRLSREGNVHFYPIEKEAFMQSMASCTGILCGAGFSTPSEALYLKKKLMVIPMKMQYEQQCNAAALKSLGVPVIKSLKPKRHVRIEEWLNSNAIVQVDYPDNAARIVETIFSNHAPKPAGIERTLGGFPEAAAA